MKSKRYWWKCKCGQRIRASVRAVASGKKRCPQCRMFLKLPDKKERPAPASDETQMVDLKQMARMAQNGVELEVSGEWDTLKAKPDTSEDA